MIRSFLDSNILIAASRSDQLNSEAALAVPASPKRKFLTSVFIRLEVYPKVAYHDFPLQRAVMQEFFMDPALEWARDLEAVVTLGLHLAERYNTSPMDSLHLASAILLHADEFVTAEKSGRPMYRVRDLNVRYIDDLENP